MPDGIARLFYIGTTEPLKLFAVHVGMFLGLTAMWLILNWRYIARTIRSAITGPTSEELEHEAIPYRVAWVIFAGCTILLLLMYYAAGTGWLGAVLLIISWFLISTGGARMFGLTLACGVTDRMYLSTIPELPFMKLALQDKVSREMVNTLCLANRRGDALILTSSTLVAMCYRIAKDTGVRARDVFIAMLIGSVVGTLTAYPVVLKIYYKVGISYTIRGTFDAWYIPSHQSPGWCTNNPAIWPWWKQFLAGVALTGILSYLRVRFIWWPIDPVGAILGLGVMPAPVAHAWECATYLEPITPFIAWIIKYLVIKLGGVAIHDEIFIPLVAGFAVGSALAWVVGGLAGMPRYLIA